MFCYAATWIAPSSAIAGDCDVMTCSLREQPDRDLHGRVVIHDQDVGHVKKSSGPDGKFPDPNQILKYEIVARIPPCPQALRV